jgi:Ca2+:H+ antiporter
MLGGLTKIERVLLPAVAALSAVAGTLHYVGGSEVVVFVLAGAALAGLAWVVSLATEALGERFGPAATGVLQSTLGNLPELFIVLFALSAGEVVVAKTSILGSIFANALLVLGLVIVAGAHRARDGVMRFHSRLPNDTATLLLLAVFIIVLLGLSHSAGDRASRHVTAISATGAVCLLVVYAAWLYGYLRGAPTEPGMERSEPRLPLALSVSLLAVSGAGAAFVSDWFVAALGPAVEEIGISREFTGLVIVAIAGNAVENVAGITLAAKGKNDLAISVVKNSVSQIAVFLFPVLVLLSLFFATPLTFVISPVFIGALALMAIAVWQITGDGQAVAFEGWALVAIYLILATLTFFE